MTATGGQGEEEQGRARRYLNQDYGDGGQRSYDEGGYEVVDIEGGVDKIDGASLDRGTSALAGTYVEELRGSGETKRRPEKVSRLRRWRSAADMGLSVRFSPFLPFLPHSFLTLLRSELSTRLRPGQQDAIAAFISERLRAFAWGGLVEAGEGPAQGKETWPGCRWGEPREAREGAEREIGVPAHGATRDRGVWLI